MSDSDASSVTSGVSGAPSETQSMRENEGPGGSADHQDGLENSHDMQAAVFGVLYTLSKEKHGQSYKFAAAMLVLDFLQLFILIFDPSFGWHIDESLWLWKYISYLEFSTPLIAKGYHFMIIVMYIIIAVLGVGFALCVWVGWCFKNDRFPLLWPIKMLRFVLHIFFSVFYVATLSIFLMPLQCNYLDKDPKIRFHLDHFHNECFAMPHMAHAGAAALATVTFVFISVVMTMADFDLNPTSQAILAAASSTVALKAIALKTVMAIASILDGRLKIQALVTTGAAWLLFWSYIRYQPHYNRWVNHVRSALYGALSWAGLLLLFLAFSKQQAEPKFQKSITTALLAGLAPVFLVVFGISYLHFEYFYRSGIRAFRAYDAADSKAKLKDVYKFTQEHQVEMLARCCRQWVDEDTLDEDAVRLAELVIKVGMVRLSSSAGVTIFYSSFLIEVLESYQSALSQLQLARKMNPNICQKFTIFVREQQHRQRAQTNRGGESAVDLVSYVEFTRNYRSIVRSHKAALYATRYFWKQLLNHNISFSALTRAFANIERNQRYAEKAYRLILERYPTSPKLLRTYGRFLEDCKNDPWGAARFYSEAENIEEEAETAQNQASFGEDGEEGENGNLTSNVDENTRAIILINATGVIQMANKLALKVFGYKKGELEGKNVSILMPNPFSQRHNSYLRNYVTSGKPKILDTVREVVGINKERYVFPLRLNVTKASGAGNDAMFMGALLAVEEPKDVVRCWLTPSGLVLCVNANFTDWFAMAHADIVGKPFASLAVEQDRVAELLEMAGNSSEEELKEGKVSIQGVQLLHKYLNPITCNIHCSLGGTDSQRLLLMQISRTPGSAEEAHNFLVADYRGQISFATSGVAKILGYAPRDMLRLNISALMEPPFSYLHAKWLAELPPNPPSTSCRSGAVLAVVASNGNTIPVKTSIKSRDVDDTTSYVVSMVKSSWEEGLDLHRLAASVGPDGVILEAGNTPASVFGFPPAQIVGVGLDSFVETVHDVVTQEGVSLEALQSGLVVKTVGSPGISWRVGVHLSGDAAAKWGLSAVRALVKPAVMRMEMAEADDSVRLFLHQADTVTGVIEVDREGRVCKTGCCAFHQPGLIFGCSSASMMGQPLSKYVDLGSLSVADALLQAAAEGQGKKSLKTGNTAAPIRLGPVKKFHGHHTDGEPLKLMLQAVPKDASQRRIVVKISLVHPSKGSAAALKRSIMGAEAGADHDGHEPDLVKRASSDGGVPSHGLHRVATGVPNRHENRKITDDVVGDGAAPAIRFQAQTASRELAFLDQDTALAASQKVLSSWPDWDNPNADPPPEDGNQSEMSGSETHVSDSASQAADGAGQGTDYRKGKRFKKLTRVLAGKRTQSAVTTFRQSTYAVLAGVLLTHLVCFVIFTNFINSLQQYVYEMDAAGRATDMIHRIAMNAVILRELHLGRSAPGIYNVSEIPHYSTLMRIRVDEFELNHRGIYLGFTKLRQLKNGPGYPLKDIWGLSDRVAEVLIDTKSPQVANETMTLWELGNTYIMSAREVMANNDRMANSSLPTANATVDMQLNRHWHFVAVNGPGALFDAYKGMMDALVARAMGQVKQVNLINVALLAVEGFAVCTVAIVVMWFLVRRVINMRYRLFSTFLIVPAGFLRVLASKQVHVDEDDLNDSDSDAEGDAAAGNMQELGAASKKGAALNAAGGNNAQTAFLQLDRKAPQLVEAQEHRTPLQLVKKVSAAVVSFLKGQDTTLGGKRKLKRDAGDATRVLAPFVVWMALVLTVYAVSYTTLGSSSEGLIDNSIANNVLFRSVRVLFFAIKFCSRETTADKEAARSWVTLTATRLGKAYNTLMYGSVKGDYSDTKYYTPGTTFHKGTPVRYFFNAQGRCWREDQSTCFGPSSEYYEISHNGLNPMLMRLVHDALLLARDDASDVNMSNSRVAYIWKVANFDLHPGLQTAARQYTDNVLASFKSALNMHVGLFVMSWVLALLFVVLIMKPFLRRVDVESRRMAELLSQLPADMDVEALVAQALGTAGDEGDKKNDAAAVAKVAPAAGQRSSLESRSAKFAAADDTSGWGKARRASFSLPAHQSDA